MSNKEIYESAIKQLTIVLDDLIGECLDENNKPKAPSARGLNSARGCLPIQYKNSLVKKRKK